jgi:hypothetical protein
MSRNTRTATTRLGAAELALTEATRRIGELTEQRNQCLLRDADGEAVELATEIENLRRLADGHRDKIKLLQDAARTEEQERRAKEKTGLIERIEKKLAARDSAGKELADAVAAADRAFRKLIDVGLEVTAAWNWPASNVPACLLSHAAVTHALQAEMYRVGGRPMLGGGQVEEKHAGIHFPGAKVPRHELTHLREKIVPLVAVLAEATAHASNILRGKQLSAQVDVFMSAPAPAMNGNAVTRITAQEALGKLVERQKQMVEGASVDEVEYKRLIDQIAEAQAAVSAEQATGAQEGHARRS